MEKSVELDFFEYLEECFSPEKTEAEQYSPLDLAYIGDCIFDLIIKTLVIRKGNKQVQNMRFINGDEMQNPYRRRKTSRSRITGGRPGLKRCWVTCI